MSESSLGEFCFMLILLIVYYRLLACRLDYQPLFGKMSPHSSPGEDQRPDPGDGGSVEPN